MERGFGGDEGEEGNFEWAGGGRGRDAKAKKRKSMCCSRSCHSFFELILKNSVVVCLVWMMIQGMVATCLAIIIFHFSGRLLHWVTDGRFVQGTLTPVIPVWNDLGDALPFGDALQTARTTVIILIVAWVIVGLLCFFFLLRRNLYEIWLLVLLGLVTLGMFILQMVLLTNRAAWQNMMLRNTGAKLVSLLQAQYRIVTRDPFSTAVNIFMVMGSCCGLYGPGDFNKVYNVTMGKDIYEGKPFFRVDNLPPWPESKKVFTVKVPPACCPNDYVYNTPDRALERLIYCASGTKMEMAHQVGCSEAYEALWTTNFRPGMLFYFIISTISLGVLVVNCILGICYRCYRSEFTDEEEEEEEEEEGEEEEEEEEAGDDDDGKEGGQTYGLAKAFGFKATAKSNKAVSQSPSSLIE